MRFIKLDNENKIISVRYGSEIVEGEIESESGIINQIMQFDGTFITPETLVGEQSMSLEDRIQQLQSDNLILMDGLAGLYETLLTLMPV